MGIVPFFIWKFFFDFKVSDLGLSFGDRRQTIILTAVGLPVMALLAYLSAKNPAFIGEYPLFRGLAQQHNLVPGYLLMYGLYYLGWELFFRGFMLSGLRRNYGDIAAVLIQTIPSCLVHIGKPDAEIFASIVAGIIFGLAALRCRSIWPVFLWHWGLGVFLDLFIIYG